MDIKKLTPGQKYLRRRILEVSHEVHMSHIGSCLSAIDLINAVYALKKKDERFILSNGHAGVALYAVLEKKGILDKPTLKKLHVHPDRNSELGIDVSTGSLGQGLPIAVGMALGNRKKRVFVLISDGECAEGSIWEALRIAEEEKLSNLYIIINANGWGAYDPISMPKLIRRLKGFVSNVHLADGHNLSQILSLLRRKNTVGPNVIVAKTDSDQLPFLKGLDAHYYVMTENDYKQACDLLE